MIEVAVAIASATRAISRNRYTDYRSSLAEVRREDVWGDAGIYAAIKLEDDLYYWMVRNRRAWSKARSFLRDHGVHYQR